jgi:hypothetical protein
MELSGQWKDLGYILILLFILGLVLVFLEKPISEGFGNQAIKCGVDMAPCAGHLKCVNGYCAETEPKAAHESNPVPLLPEGVPVPFF